MADDGKKYSKGKRLECHRHQMEWGSNWTWASPSPAEKEVRGSIASSPTEV